MEDRRLNKEVKVLAILQARMSSSRLPGKVLKPLLGKPMLERQLERLQQVKKIDLVLVATSDGDEDSAIEELCKKVNVPCFRGSLNDVLNRFYQAAKTYQPEHVVRLTGDCPLVSPKIIDKVISQHLSSDKVYTSNCYPPSLPDGLDMEIFTWDALEVAEQEVKSDYDREHVTTYIRNNLTKEKQGFYIHPTDLSAHRWTVDYPEDFKLVSEIFSELYPKNQMFELNDILVFLEENPELSSMNQHKIRNETCQ